MISLRDLERIVPDAIKRLHTIRCRMSTYKKINTDYRAKTLMNEIDAKIKQVESVYQLYREAPSYRTKDFTNWVSALEHYIAECQQIYEKIKAYESVEGYN